MAQLGLPVLSFSHFALSHNFAFFSFHLFSKTGIELVGVWKKYVLSLYWATATATSTG